MSAKIIQFPKNPTRADEWHYFKMYHPLYLFTVTIWSALIFTLMYEWQFSNFKYEVGVGFGIWSIGLLLLAGFTYFLGLKRNQRLRKYRHEKEDTKLTRLMYGLIGRGGTCVIYFITIVLGAVATIAFTVIFSAKKQKVARIDC